MVSVFELDKIDCHKKLLLFFTMNFSIWWIFTYYLRPIIKWFLRKTTGLCELQRICYGKVSGAPRVKGVEHSLHFSRSKQIRQLIDHLNDIADHKRFTGANEREILKGRLLFLGIIITYLIYILL